jgi:general stress protein CsbA
MKYRLLFICLLSVLFASLTMNVIHSECLEAVKEVNKINEMVHTKMVSSLHDRLMELEN